MSKYVQELEMAPGWHRLPNGVVVYSDPIALRLADPKDSVEKAYKSRMTLAKEKNGQWTQLEKVDDITAGGSEMFRKIGINEEPQRTLSFFAPSRFKDYWEHDSEVPISPFPEPEDAIQSVEWSEDDAEEIEEMEQQVENQDIEKLVIAKHPHEVELDETMFSEKTSVKDLQMARKERNLPYTGSKKRLLERLMNFKINIETQMQLSIANKIYKEQQRIPVTIGQPKLPSLAEQERHFITHMPYAGWCQACVASRAKEDKHVNREEQEDQGRNLIQMDFCYTYTGEDQRGDEPTLGKVHKRQDQFRTCLILTSSETKAIYAVPVPSKGTASLKTITEEVARFALENSAYDPVIFQADPERAMRQTLRSVQQVRSVMGLKTEIRMTGTGQHASNGQVERAVQTVRKLANCLRTFAEDRARLRILGSFHLYPWSFRYASFLLNRFRVLEKCNKTSFELATGHGYHGKLALFGESVLFKKMVKYKGNNVFERGIWAGKRPWNDSHVILTPDGAFEARAIRRLAAGENFIATDMAIAKGLPWSYSPQGILMRHAGDTQRTRIPSLEVEAEENEMKEIAADVASGLIGPTPGLRTPAPRTPGVGQAAPGTPAPGTPAPQIPQAGVKRTLEEGEDEGQGAKRIDDSTSPRRMHEKREAHGEVEEQEKKQKVEDSSKDVRMPESSPRGSPSNPPGYAGVNAVSMEVHGDDEVDWNLIPDEVEEEFTYGGEEDDDPPVVTEERLAELDKQAREKEIQRMMEMPAMIETDENEVTQTEGYIISTKEVYCWKHRLEIGGWFRRARLVARQFRSSIDLEQTFAPTSMMMVPKLLIHLIVNVFTNFKAMTLDIKDAFLMAPQPADEAFRESGWKNLSTSSMPTGSENCCIAMVPIVCPSTRGLWDESRRHATDFDDVARAIVPGGTRR